MSDKNTLNKLVWNEIFDAKSRKEGKKHSEDLFQSLTILIFKGREEIEYQLKHFWLILIPVKILLIKTDAKTWRRIPPKPRRFINWGKV